jgi:hypothetical protein
MTRVPEGLAPLLAMRQSGTIPSKCVSLDIGDGWKKPDWHKFLDFRPNPVGRLPAGVRASSLDLRVLKGMTVFIHSQSYDKQAVETFNAVKQYAAMIVLVVLDWDGDMIEWKATGESE